jgi:hypothetical protein
MEIVEIISYFVNDSTDTIEIKFRLNEDDESELRFDEIELREAKEFGYQLVVEDLDFFTDEDEEDGLDDFIDEGIDEDELLSFINEYYMIYPERLPEKDLY